MMAMSAEELGRRFREHGEWRYSKKYSSLNNKSENFSSVLIIYMGIVVIVIANCLLSSLSFLRRKYHYDEFDNLIGTSEHSDGARSLDGFMGYLGNYGEDDKETSLGEYRNAIHDMIQMYYDNEPYTDEEIGRILKFMIPIVFMVNDGVKINIQNYSILDSKYNLTKQTVELDKHLKAEADKRKAESNANIEEKERLKQEKEEQEEENRKRKEQ